MNKKLIWPTVKHFCNEAFKGIIHFGIAGWMLFGVVILVGEREWLGWTVIGLILAFAVLDTVISLRDTIKKAPINPNNKEDEGE